MSGSPSPRDLELLDLTEEQMHRSILVRSGFAAALVVFAWCVAHFTTGARIGPVWGLVLAASTAGAVVGTRRSLVARAAAERADMNLALAVFLDLTNVMLAGGMGVESAVVAAADAGDSPAFARIRTALARARSSRSSYWDGLRELGHATGVESLVDVAASAQLAGEFGARVRQTLAAKARGLRQHNLAQVEHDAETRTEKLGLPLVLLFMAFILLVGYPAFVRTVSSF